jgi:hypothetical protein
MLMALVFTFGPAAHPDWSWTNLDDVKLIALFAAISIAPKFLRWLWRDIKAGGGLLASLGAPTDQPYEPPIAVRLKRPGD